MISSVISRSQLQSLFASNVCKFPVRTKRNISCSGRPSHLRLFIASSKLDFFMSRRVPDGLPNRRSDCGGGMRYQDRVNRHPKGQSTPQYCQELPFRHRWCGGRHAFALSTCRGLPRQEQDKPRGGDARVCKSSRAQRHLFDALRQAINHCCFRQSAESCCLSPWILSKSRQDGEDRERRTIELGTNLCKKKSIEARVFQSEGVRVGHCYLPSPS